MERAKGTARTQLKVCGPMNGGGAVGAPNSKPSVKDQGDSWRQTKVERGAPGQKKRRAKRQKRDIRSSKISGPDRRGEGKVNAKMLGRLWGKEG